MDRTKGQRVTGARFWRVVDGLLVSPFAYDVLPEDGLLVAHCEAHEPPAISHGCGVAYYSTREQAESAARWLGGEPFAITEGTVFGPTAPERHMSPYQVGDRWVNVPTGRRARAYQVTDIWTDATGLVYDLPVHAMSRL